MTHDRRGEIDRALKRIAPRTPHHETLAILDHALTSRGLRNAAPEHAAWLSLVAYVRHIHTDYDELLQSGYDLDSGRHFVRADMEAVLRDWGVRRPLVASDLDAPGEDH